MPLEYLKSEKGKPKLVDQGHLYIKDKEGEEKVFWKCERSRKDKCRGRVHTIGDDVVHRTGEHNHAADAAHVGAVRVLEETKNQAVATQDTPHLLVARAFNNATAAIVPNLPRCDSLKRTIRNVRNRVGNLPANPQSLEELQFPPEYTITNAGKNDQVF